MTIRFHRGALLALALMIAAFAASGASATGTEFPTARQVAMHEGRLGASSTQAAVQFPTARQIALHENTLSSPAAPSNEARVASNPGFSWADAGIGAGAALVIATAVLYGAFIVNNRRQRGVRRATTA
jgi:hypothetical protein